MTTGRTSISDTLASQETVAIKRSTDHGAAAGRPAHSKPTEILKKNDLGVPHQKAISKFVTEASEKIRRRNLLGEYLFIAVSTVAVLATGFAAWYTEGRIFTDLTLYLRSFEPEASQTRDKRLACKDPRNRKTPYCQGVVSNPEHSGIGTVNAMSKGKPLPFTLHD